MPTVSDTYQQVHYWYQEYQLLFINMALKCGYKREEAADMVSQFFLELMEKNRNMDAIANPQAYLSTAFRRKLIDRHRASKKEIGMATNAWPEYGTELSAQEKLEQVQTDTELIRKLQKAYQKLPDRCRKVIYLKFYKGLTTEAIAAQTGLTKRTVYNNLFEGVKLLRMELQAAAPDVPLTSLISLLPLLTAVVS